MSSSLDKLLEVGSNGPSVEVARRREKHPPGFEPGAHVKRSGGSIVVKRDSDGPVDWSAVLRELVPESMNPDDYEIDGDTVEVRAWDGNVGMGEIKRFYYFKAKIRRKDDAPDGVNLDDIIAAATKARPKPIAPADNERTYFFQITDLQAGQGDGDGVDGMVARALQIPELVKSDIAALKKQGRPATSIFIPITGDLVEGIEGWYEAQRFTVSLDRRDQVKLVRRVLTQILIEVSSLGLPVHVAAVAGNHGENRNAGKAFTNIANDNDDVAVVEQIAEAFALSEKFGHVSFSLPGKERLSLTVDVLGWVIGLTHGHVARATGTPAAKILAWFKSMAASRDPIGDSDLLFTGHFHHYIAQQLIGDTWLLQGGALCDTSSWFSQTAGLVSDPIINKGTITRDQKIESLMPYAWNRSKVQTRTLD